MTREEIYAPKPVHRYEYVVSRLADWADKYWPDDDDWEILDRFSDDQNGLDHAKMVADQRAEEGFTVKVFRVTKKPQHSVKYGQL